MQGEVEAIVVHDKRIRVSASPFRREWQIVMDVLEDLGIFLGLRHRAKSALVPTNFASSPNAEESPERGHRIVEDCLAIWRICNGWEM